MLKWCKILPVWVCTIKKVIDVLRKIDDPYPYFRGLILDIGYERAVIFI